MNARISYDEIPGGGIEPWELVFLWVGARAGEAVVNQVVQMATAWMREQFRQDLRDTRARGAHIILYEGDEGRVFEIVELKSADEEPVRRSLEDFERYTQKKPSEGVRRWKG